MGRDLLVSLEYGSCIVYGTIIVSVWVCISMQTVDREGLSPTQTCSCAVFQHPNCKLLDIDEAVHWSNADWLTIWLE